ncbi:chromate transport protein [Phenylobacterium zucineum HLK1]|uniref:Chromate transport protein n=1 Tax=Phenylobacterium zucineum (strain HLK1) TaxID=450851 RepID=B4RGP2_PHEZH|nr:chromate efflux transporter [Phenylobacterium zucineum]ACG77258.1 chromate transport protein [Phenylobacterium zucineum HLK1]
MDAAPPQKAVTPLEVFLAFLKQGLTAFGGPVAHLAYFRREFVERRGWVSDAAFADLLALCHFLPGPASSQLGMAIGLRQAGLAGALAAFAGFTLPAGAAMIAFAYLAPDLETRFGSGWIHGLKIAAAAVVLQALVQMARSLAVGPVRAGMAIGAAAGLILSGGPVAQVAAILAGGAFGWALLRDEAGEAPPDEAPAVDTGSAAISLALFAGLLLALPLLAALLANPGLALASVFYRTGALVFGGGHVVLPLLESEVVARGWLDQDTFLSGYGAVQALPGPLFSFAGFVGAAQSFGPRGIVGGLIALFAIFLPSLLLVVGVLPFWDRLKKDARARGALAGVGAVVVGLLGAALWDPVLSTTIERGSDWALLAAAFVFLAVARLPPWLVVVGFATATGALLR